MKVKELAVVFKTTVDEILKLLDNVGVNIAKQEETNVEKDVEKKLARYFGITDYKPATKPKATKTTSKPTIIAKPIVEPKPVTPKEPVVAKPTLKTEPVTGSKPTKQEPLGQKGQNVQEKQEPNVSKNQKAQEKPEHVQKTTKPEVAKPDFGKTAQVNRQTQNTNNQKDQRNKPQPQKPYPQKPEQKQFSQSQKPQHQHQKPQPKQEPVQVAKPKPKRPIVEDEPLKPRVDEEILNKYADFLEDDEYNITRESRGKRKDSNSEGSIITKQHKRTKQRDIKKQQALEEDAQKILYYEKGMTVLEVAEGMKVPVKDLVKKLFVSIGVMASATTALERETIELIAIEYDYEVQNKKITDMVRFDEMEIVDSETDLVPRPPIVTIMGHVDHGKTTLLDTIRSSHVVQGEAGGITQHIGAYQVEKGGHLITFVDTPGHAAFTEMRARGAQITDIVILVVAADDGVMPQTREAIEHAQAANVPIIVAINKMDRPGANPERIKQDLTEYNLLAEEWGGDTIYVPISALTGKGVDELLEMVILVSELKNYRANPNRPGVGTVVEAKLDKGRGPVATLLVQNGTVRTGDVVVVGNTYGKIRAMQDENGRVITSAGPSKPVEITGISEVPFAGDRFMIFNDERKAREIAEVRAQNKFNDEKGVGKTISLNELLKKQPDDSIKQLNLIIKCDVQGSIEAIRGLLEKITIEGTKINIVAARVGGITESDINLAIASSAVIIGFNIRPQAFIVDLAKEKGIEIRLYDIIYKLQEDIEKAVKGMLDPVFEEKVMGEAEVRETFKVSKVGTIAGCYVTNGVIPRNSGIRLIRNSIVIYTGRLSSLRRFKDDVKEVKAGYECGLTIENYNDIKVGDIVECFVMEEIERV